jgi:hypothetical protein
VTGQSTAILPADYWSTAEVMQGLFKTKLCLAKRHSPDGCGNSIVAAHTIPRSQLRQIAVDGHVYAVAASAADLARNDGTLTAKKYGIGKFSVLNCFCNTHDNSIFTHIEDDPLEFDAHQLNLLQYRTIASELYRKVMSRETLLYQLGEEQKKKKADKTAIVLLEATAAGELAAIRDIGTAFDRCSKNLFAAKYDDVSALIVHFKQLPSVMTVGGFLPQYDYNAKTLQLIYDLDTIAQTISFNILAANGHAALVMLWFKDHDLVNSLAGSFIAQDQARYTTLAIQTAFEYLENTCVSPNWWEGEKPIVQKTLLARMQNGGSPFEERKAHCLSFCGIGFDDWDYDSHEFLNVD